MPRTSALLFALLVSLAASPARAYVFLEGYETAPNVAAALERVRAQPHKHVLLYFGQSEFCPPCKEARAILNSSAVRVAWQPNYVVVNIDLFAPTKEEREVIEQVRVSWAPVLVFLNGEGRRVAYTRQLRGEADALRMNAFVSQRQYVTPTIGSYSARGLDPGAVRRAVAEVASEASPIDDRPRLKDVTAQPHQRLTGAELRTLLLDRRLRKENQDWFLTLEFRARNLLEVAGSRKNGGGDMRGVGKWYVTKKGKLCLDVDMRGVDERWCRHVLRAGETYYVAKDLRPDRLVYRMVPDRG